jgi:Kef-type K+ transport system membrane component KefB
MHHQFPPILYVVIAAALAPVIGHLTRRIGVSIVVIELLLGIALGPQGFALVTPTAGSIPALATFGMAFLFFIAGLEIDLPAIGTQPLRTAALGWLACLLLAVGCAHLLRVAGLAHAWEVVAIALATTALGVLVPIMRDAGVTDSAFGRNVMALGVMGEVGPILIMSLVLARRHTAETQAGLTVAFVAFVLVLAWLLARGARVPALLKPLRRGLDQSGQLPVRLTFVLIIFLAVLAENFGLDLALGALAAGMMAGFAVRGGERTHDLVAKLDAIGYGFLVPIFFLTSGMKLDVRSIFASTQGLALLAAFVVALVATRLPLMWLLRGALPGGGAAGAGFLSATTLSLVVVLTQVAVEAGVMPSSEAAPLVGAGMLTVLLFPLLGLKLAGVARGERRGHEDYEGL